LHNAFLPESVQYYWQVFWLISLLLPFPSDVLVCRSVVMQKLFETYSSGYCSGIAPDSLFIIHVYTGMNQYPKLHRFQW